MTASTGNMWWLMERAAFWTSLTQLGRRSTVPWEISPFVPISWRYLKVCSDLLQGAGGKGWDIIVVVWNWTLYNEEYKPLGGIFWNNLSGFYVWYSFALYIFQGNSLVDVCAFKKQNDVICFRSLVWSGSEQQIYFRSNTGELLVTSEAQYSNTLQELEMSR